MEREKCVCAGGGGTCWGGKRSEWKWFGFDLAYTLSSLISRSLCSTVGAKGPAGELGTTSVYQRANAQHF